MDKDTTLLLLGVPWRVCSDFSNEELSGQLWKCCALDEGTWRSGILAILQVEAESKDFSLLFLIYPHTLVVASTPAYCGSQGDRTSEVLLIMALGRIEILPRTWMDSEGFIFPVVHILG